MPKSVVDKLLEEVKLKKGKPKVGYVFVTPSAAHAAILDRWASRICRIAFSTPKKEYHVTLMYDARNKVERTNARRPQKGKVFKGEPINVALYGKKEDALVLELHSPDLAKRHEQLKGMGFKHSYKKFRPHVTIKDANTTKGDFAAAAANLGVLVDMLPQMAFYWEDWRETRD